MSLFKRILDFYIQSSIHVGLALFSLAFVTVFENDTCRHITYPSCILFGTILGYNFLKYFGVARKGNLLRPKYYAIILVSLCALAGYGFFFVKMVNSIQIQLLIGALLVLLYLPLRRYGILKMFFVAFVIAYLTAFVFLRALPLYNGNEFFEFLKRFVFVSALMIPFEIYDSTNDPETLNTLPQKYGIQTSKKVGYALLLLFGVLTSLSYCFNPVFTINDLAVAFLIALLTGTGIRFSTLDGSFYYSKFWIESIPILWLVLLMFLS